MPKNKAIELTLDERFQIWELVTMRRKKILEKRDSETPRTKRLLSIAIKMGKC